MYVYIYAPFFKLFLSFKTWQTSSSQRASNGLFKGAAAEASKSNVGQKDVPTVNPEKGVLFNSN
jgi:hypothetical protein